MSADRRRRLLLMLTSAAVAFAVAEGVLRLIEQETLPQASVLFSSQHWALDQRGAVRHMPNEAVRMVSVYADTVEFDVAFRTNNLGLVDHRDYPSASDTRRHYAFVGDSFTHGMGADPWVPKLRDQLQEAGRQIEIYNLGVNGASVQHFRKLLSSAAAELLISHIVVIAISNDFLRPWWVPIAGPSGSIACRDPPDCKHVRPMMPIFKYGASVEEVLRQHRAITAEITARQPVDAWWKRALWQSRLYEMLRRSIDRIAQRVAPAEAFAYDLEDPRLLDVNLEALAGIRADFPRLPITLAHFPQKDEVERRGYDLDLAEPAGRLGIDYFAALTGCEWSLNMYHRVNGHPNASGYENFAQCLSRHLFQ